MESQNANRLLLPFAQVQRLWAKSRCFSPSPGTFRQVQSFQLKSRTFGPSPGVWGQVQSFQLKSRTFGSSPGVLCQVQALWVKSSRLGPSPRLFGEIYRTSSKSSLKIPSPAPKISCMSPLTCERCVENRSCTSALAPCPSRWQPSAATLQASPASPAT